MSTSLTVLRERNEHRRFAREHVDDTRTAIPSVDARSLAEALRRQTNAEVRFDRGSRALYATDGSNYRQVPIGVVVPRSIDDVVTTVRLARQYDAPIFSRGGGTSLAGQCCNVAVCMDMSKYLHHVTNVDVQQRLGSVEPGCVLDDFRTTTKKHGLIFGPDPATHTRCTLGGMLGNNSCGVHSLLAKDNGFGLRTSDNTHELDILTYDGARFTVGRTPPDELDRIIRAGGRRGQIYRDCKALIDKYADLIRAKWPKLGRRVSGYNLDDLLPENGFHMARALVGSESTLVTILGATLHIVPNPKARSLLVLGYPDAFKAADHLMEILEYKPTGLEGIDEKLFHWVKAKGDENANIALMPPGGGWLLVEFGGDSKDDSDAQAKRLMEDLKKKGDPPAMKLFDDPHEEEMIWKVREGSLASTTWVPGHPDTWPGFEDSAVPVDQVHAYLPALRDLMDKYNYHPSLYGHFGQGCIHCRIGFDLYTTDGIEHFEKFMHAAADLVASFGGTMSGEHGDGQARAQFLPKIFGPELVQAMREFKGIWDPQRKMNPGKTIDAYSITTNLRLGPDYDPPQPQTYFHFPADRHSFSRAVLRCVGVAACRNEGGQTMCPSYMVTREEKDCTRGRARLLFEMMNGDTLTEGWKSPAVKDALDLCLSCKGCKHDCPVNVDMATYKAEFLAHYYEGRLRPRHAYAFGWIHIWSRLASLAPTLANAVTQTPGLRAVAKWMAGMEQARRIPPFAPVPFKTWWKDRPRKNLDKPPVILFADTFNNYYHPETSKAAVEVLEDAGFRVEVPQQDMCCGRPLYDYGFLGMAKRWMKDIIEKLAPAIEAEIPIVVLEPSCAAVFRDELSNILPENNHHARRLHAQVFLLSEFLQKKAPHYQPPKLHRKALLHVHCHHKSVMGAEAEQAVLKKMAVDYHEPEDGCCGMAGAFGFERGDHYDVSIKCGERVLLPDVRKTSDEDLLIADGFSCREQVQQTTDRTPLHLAQVIQLAKRPLSAGARPEARLVRARHAAHRRAALQTASCAAAGLVLGAVAYAALRDHRRDPRA